MEDIKLRLATSSDAEMLFEWRNSPEVRRYSLSSTPLIKSEHLQWLDQTLKRPDRCLLIAEWIDKPIGVLRFDIKDTKAEISIYLCPSFMGKGLGTEILNIGLKWVEEHLPQIEALQAQVILENIASVRLFEKAGFKAKLQLFEKEL